MLENELDVNFHWIGSRTRITAGEAHLEEAPTHPSGSSLLEGDYRISAIVKMFSLNARTFCLFVNATTYQSGFSRSRSHRQILKKSSALIGQN